MYVITGESIEYDGDWDTSILLPLEKHMQLLEKFDVELLIGQVSYKQSSDIYNCWNKYEHPTATPEDLEDLEPSTRYRHDRHFREICRPQQLYINVNSSSRNGIF